MLYVVMYATDQPVWNAEGHRVTVFATSFLRLGCTCLSNNQMHLFLFPNASVFSLEFRTCSLAGASPPVSLCE